MHHRHPYHQYEHKMPQFEDDEENITFQQMEEPNQMDAQSEEAPEGDSGVTTDRVSSDAAIKQVQDQCQAEIAEVRLRAAAEMDNFKKRLGREHEEKMRFAAENILKDLLPTLDNFDLALQYGNHSDACKDMLDGLAVTRKLMLEAVAKHGLAPIGEAGEEFDPTFHEALGFEAHPDYAPNSVSRVLQQGYTLNDRLLRPAKVMVTP